MKRRRCLLALLTVAVMLLSMFAPVGSKPVNAAGAVSVSYQTHVQSIGWQEWKRDGQMAGTSGLYKRLEGIRINVSGDSSLGIRYTTHCQSYGWLPWSSNGETNGTEGEAKRLEAIKIKLTGAGASNYDVYYRVHAQSYGWLTWAKNGEPAGTAGFAKRLEAIQIVILPKGQTPAQNLGGITPQTAKPYIPLTSNASTEVAGETETHVMYKTHVQSIGWQGWKVDGNIAGTSGLAKRLEGIEIKLTNKQYPGSICYRTHVQSIGWQNVKWDGAMSGTSGQAKRLEAIQIALSGEMAEHYDIYYRVHAQTYGWLGWVKNGAAAGTAGYAKRLEAIQIVLVRKNGSAPGNVGGIASKYTQGYVGTPIAPLTASGQSSNPGTEPGPTTNPEASTDVTKYTYKITPLLAPFNDYFFVETDNPDPSYVRFVDKSSIYYTSGQEPCVLLPEGNRFADVQYENYETGRVNGGYIFSRDGYDMDGGELVLQQADSPYKYQQSGNFIITSSPDYEDTTITVNCPAVKDYVQYLVDTYAPEGTDFFDRLGKISSALSQLAIYPKQIQDTSKPNTYRPYPLLAASPYSELSLNEHYDMYSSSGDKLFALYLHPFVLDSLGYPGTIAAAARLIDPNCTVENGSAHYLVNITHNGTTKTYGGAGEGTTDPLYTKYVEKLFLFNGAANDYATHATVENLSAKVFEYAKKSSADLDAAEDLIHGETFKNTVFPGSWIRVGVEGWGYGEAYSYVGMVYGDSYADSIEDVWIVEQNGGGRYINVWNQYEEGAVFSEHPTADILVRNMTYTNYKGVTVTRDVLYEYDKTTDTWRAPFSYVGDYWYSASIQLPDDMILTHEEVTALNPDGKTNELPASGFIYDGTVEPGTPFTN